MNIQTEFTFPAAGGSCSTPSGVCALPVQTGGGSFRVCKKCGRSLPLSEFYSHTRKTGTALNYFSCKSCWAEAKKRRRIANPGKYAEQDRKWQQKNREKCRANCRRWKLKHPELYVKCQKKYYDANREKRIETSKRYRLNNIEKYRGFRRAQYSKSKSYRISVLLRRRMFGEMKKASAKKSKTTFELLGCTISEFKKYIESIFLPGMSWENHSIHGWHLDHIIPISSFDLTKPDQQKICFNYKNIQPLWAEDNLRKSDKIIS
jgi:hypothetical protein